MKINQYLCCPLCKSSLVDTKASLKCIQCRKKYLIEDSIVCFGTNVGFQRSHDAWNVLYEHQLKKNTLLKDFREYTLNYYTDTYRQLTEVKSMQNSVYLEIGCGPCFMGQLVAKECNMIIGIDISMEALKIAKKMFEKKGIKNYLLIQGDIRRMPIKGNAIDLVYGGGVIEHFRETQDCVNEIYRVLRRRGVSVNSVPMCNIGSLTYRQVWGNIPNIPFIKPLFEFIHMHLLGARHMKYGYEMSFTRMTLDRIHRKAGFKQVIVNKFDAKLFFEFLPQILRPISIFLATHFSLFWPMIKAVAIK